MKICIIGAGWFGCYLGLKLSQEKHQIKIFEKNKDIFSNSSGNNQNRLHLGFHYPRSHNTISISKKGFKEFKKEFSFLTKKIKNNIYSISSNKNSKINFKKYCSILKNSKLKFKKIDQENIIKYKFKNLDGSISCNEEVILTNKAKLYFKKKLGNIINFNKEIKDIKKENNKFKIKNEKFDIVINCSGFQLMSNQNKDITHEYCSIFLYKQISKNEHPALTIMDGPFFTLYPWDDCKNFGLYSVKDSRLAKNKSFSRLKKLSSSKINKKYLHTILKKVEKKFSYYYPDFNKNFKFSKFLLSYRVILENKQDSRICKVTSKKGYISVLPGKIDHIFYAYSKIKKCLNKY